MSDESYNEFMKMSVDNLSIAPTDSVVQSQVQMVQSQAQMSNHRQESAVQVVTTNNPLEQQAILEKAIAETGLMEETKSLRSLASSHDSSVSSISERNYPYLLGKIKDIVITIVNDVRWASVNFATDKIEIDQDEKMLKIPVIRSDRTDNKVRIHWSIPEKLASDKIYTSMKGILTIPEEETSASIPIELFPRPLESEASKFTVVLGPGISDEACVGGDTECSVTINNNIGKYLLFLLSKKVFTYLQIYVCQIDLEIIQLLS